MHRHTNVSPNMVAGLRGNTRQRPFNLGYIGTLCRGWLCVDVGAVARFLA